MAPTTKLRDTNFTDIGVAGRKTGITIKDTGQRDAFGMEHLDDFFNSPDKELTEPNSSPARIGSNGGTISIDETMDIVTSELPARISSRASLPPRARSPIKTSLNSPARRASSVGLSSPAHIQAPINRKLTFGKSGTLSALESSPALPPPLPSARSSSSVDPPPQSKNTTKPNGSSMLKTDKPQQKPKNQPLTQVTEEPILISSPAEPLAKKAPAKRGLLVSKKPAGSKKAFSLDDTDSGSEGVGNVGREGLSVVLGEGGVVEGDTVMAEAQEEAQGEVGEEEEALPKKWRATKQKPKPPPKKAAKATEKDPAPVKANSKAKGKKPVEPEPEQESEPEPAPPVKPARGKKAKAPEVEPETDPAPVKPTRAKKAPTKIPEPETELDPAPTKPTRRKKAAVKAPELETESDPARVKPTRGKKAAAKAPETETESDPALVKPTHGKKAKAVKETETESEPAPPVKPAKGKKAVSKVLETETEPEPVPKAKPAPKGRGRKVAKPIVESSSSGEPEREPTPLPKPATKPRGKGRAKLAELEQEPEDRDDQEEPPKKRTKTTKEKSTKPSAKPSAKAKGKAPTKPQKAKVLSPEPQPFTSKPQRTRSSPQKPAIVKKGGQRIIKQPPPPPRATSEEPGAVRRSTRAHIAPLAFWKGEKIMYGLTAQHESSGTIALPTITEVIRVESDSEAEQEKAEKRRKRPTTAGTKRKLAKFEEEDEDGLEEEEWESRVVDGEVGVVRGYVKTYGPSIKETPDEEEIEERELAFSRNRIVTVEVANGDFTFVKTCTEDFFGTGMVEIPPGGIKRTKNSGKMHLVFYVISGKVEVKIGDNEFRVRKGAQFMVPRGNLYSIENPYDFQAKMFFAQGCEKVITAEDRGDGEDDEEMKG